MKTMVDEGQAETLLEHPLCRAFLHLKWGRVRKFYLARILLCTIFVLVFSFYAIITNGCIPGDTNNATSAETNESMAEKASDCLCNCIMMLGNCTMLGNDECKKNMSAEDNCQTIVPEGHQYLFNTSRYCLCVLIVIEFLRKWLGILGSSATSVRHYVFQGQNLLEWAMLIGAVILCVKGGIVGDHLSWVRPIEAISLLCAWIDLLTVIGHLPTFAAYVHMYSTVLKEFYRLLLAYACLLIGFMMAFMILFPGNDKFPTSAISFVKVLMFATGELSDELLKGESHIALVVFVMFILLVTVALMNLLVGIAVHDIQGLQRTAGLTGLIQQTELVAYVESALFAGAGKVCCGLKFRLLRLLRRSALVSPSAYRVVLSVRPCDPRDRRLPPSVTADALEVARSRNKLRRMTSQAPNGSADAFSAPSTLSQFCHHCNARSSLQGSGKRNWEGKLMKDELSRLNKEVGDIKKSLDKISLALETLVNTNINSHKPHRKISEESL